jgi:hypothetical protein
MRNLEQDPSSIPSLGITAAGSAMAQIEQDLQSLPHDPVGSCPVDVGHKTNAAAILLEQGS